MEFPKNLYVVLDAEGTAFAGRGLTDLPVVLLDDGAEIGVYLFRRVKVVEITRKLKTADALEQLPLTTEA